MLSYWKPYLELIGALNSLNSGCRCKIAKNHIKFKNNALQNNFEFTATLNSKRNLELEQINKRECLREYIKNLVQYAGV